MSGDAPDVKGAAREAAWGQVQAANQTGFWQFLSVETQSRYGYRTMLAQVQMEEKKMLSEKTVALEALAVRKMEAEKNFQIEMRRLDVQEIHEQGYQYAARTSADAQLANAEAKNRKVDFKFFREQARIDRMYDDYDYGNDDELDLDV